MNKSIIQQIVIDVDIGEGLVQHPLRCELMRGDKNANRIVARIKRNKSPIDISELSVSGSFIRPPDGAEIPLEGSAHGNEASVLLDEACYASDGYFECTISLTQGETRRTILQVTGNVASKGSGVLVDIGNVIPSIDDIIAQYDTMKRVTEETEAARDQAIAASKQANFTVLGRFETLEQLLAAHPEGEAGQAFAVGTADDNEVYIWSIDTLSWVNIGPVQGAQGPQGTTGATGAAGKDGEDGEDGFSPTVEVEDIEGGHRVSITDASGTKTFDVMDGTNYDQSLNMTSDVTFKSVTAEVVYGAVFME